MMKTSRLFIALLLLSVAASGYAQDGYRQAVKEYLILNGQVNQLTSALKTVSTIMFESEGQDLKQMTERYVEECLMDKITDITLPKMKEQSVSETDLKDAISLLSTPAGQLFNEHEQAWTEAMRGELSSLLIKNLPKIMSGNISDPIQPKADIEEGYIEKHKKVLGAHVIESFMQMFDQQTNSISRFGQIPESMKQGLKTWMNTNLETIAMNSAYGIITDDDLDFAAKLYSQESYNKLKGIANMNGGELGAIGIDMITDYVNWMQDHGASVRDGAIEMIMHTLGN